MSGAEKDQHISPWDACLFSTQLFLDRLFRLSWQTLPCLTLAAVTLSTYTITSKAGTMEVGIRLLNFSDASGQALYR
jgi:hypothetical protein